MCGVCVCVVVTCRNTYLYIYQRPLRMSPCSALQPKLHFTLNKDTGLPDGCDVYERKDTHK